MININNKNIYFYIKNIRIKLRYWEYLYYIRSLNVVNDFEYDNMILKLKYLEEIRPDLITNNSPSVKINFKTNIKFKKIKHRIPMLSLKNIFNESEFLLFDKKLCNILDYNKNIKYCCEPKIDGLAINIIYINGKIYFASTRGNGNIGEDLTKNIKNIKNIPNFIKNKSIFPKFIEIRGEVCIFKKNLLKINKLLFHKGKKIFSNTRNAASGILRTTKTNNKYIKYLMFYCYGIGFTTSNNLPQSHFKLLDFLKKFDIPIIKKKLCVNKYHVLNIFNKIFLKKSNFLFDIDGVVIKVDLITFQKKIGLSSKHPKWAIAYKFLDKEKKTKIINIKFKIGRTGILTPIAILNPIKISGVVIKRANLYNISEIKRLKIMIGDTVLVKRSCNVIPKIVRVIKSHKFKKEINLIIPNKCPICNSKLIKYKKNLKCFSGIFCPSQKKLYIKNFVSRKAMNIQRLNINIINKLVDLNIIKTPSDLFKLNKDILTSRTNFNKKIIKKILYEIKKSKNIKLSKFIYAIGIYEIGETKSFYLSSYYGNLKNIINADVTSLIRVRNIGKIVASNIVNFFKNKKNLLIINDLLSKKVGVKIIN
ncbi:MAG: NAD-dependent DNA ligase LigA [Candidatus Makana argininalis]